METFVVRIWRPADEAEATSRSAPTSLRGSVKHVGTGTRTGFRGGKELLRFLQASPEAGALEWDENPMAPDEGDR